MTSNSLQNSRRTLRAESRQRNGRRSNYQNGKDYELPRPLTCSTSTQRLKTNSTHCRGLSGLLTENHRRPALCQEGLTW